MSDLPKVRWGIIGMSVFIPNGSKCRGKLTFSISYRPDLIVVCGGSGFRLARKES